MGKTRLARLIHRLSPRAAESFVSVNCGAIPRELFEREMFGHVKGAFTGATESRPGLFEAAHRGTLFLDEIGELPLEMQPKLLRVLDDGAVRRLGATSEFELDVRIITATNRNLRELVDCRLFREDLFYRCCVLEFRVPPLRERRSAIPGIAMYFLREASDAAADPAISPDALAQLCAYGWPGNLRELGNCLCQATVAASGRPISVRDLPERVRSPGPAGERGGPGDAGERRPRYATPTSSAEEREMILRVLAEVKGNRTHAARRLGMSRSTLWTKLRLYGIA